MCVTSGSMKLLTSSSSDSTDSTTTPPGVVVNAGETVFIAKGSRFRPTFPVDCSYIPVCLPAFSPDRCIREDTDTEEGKAIASKLSELHSKPAAKPSEPKPEVLYHMCPKVSWEKSVSTSRVYYPETYAEDGYYTHATGVPSRLVSTANHFYTDSLGAWVCLRFTRASLYDRGIHVRDESAMPVGDKAVGEEWGEWVCPHVMGGILPEVVDEVYDMVRDEEGNFKGIEGLDCTN